MRGLARRTMDRAGSVPIGWLVVAFSLAQVADLASALVVARELNPLAATIVSRPLLAFALKIGLIALVVATAEICDRRRPVLARMVLVIGTVAGLLGALSNTHLTPFLTA